MNKLHDFAVCFSLAASAAMVAWPLWAIGDVLWEIYRHQAGIKDDEKEPTP